MKEKSGGMPVTLYILHFEAKDDVLPCDVQPVEFFHTYQAAMMRLDGVLEGLRGVWEKDHTVDWEITNLYPDRLSQHISIFVCDKDGNKVKLFIATLYKQQVNITLESVGEE